MNSNFENKLNQNNSPEIGRIIDESFATFKKTVWISGVGIILVLLLVLPITFYAIFNYLEISSMEDFVQKSQTLESDFNYLLMNSALGIVITTFIAPITAGFYKINHLAKENKEFGLNNLFNYYKSPHFKHLALSAFLVAIYSNVMSLGLTYINLQTVGALIQLFIGLLFVFTIPLIIFENQTALQAMSNSSRLAMKHPFSIILCLLFGILIAMLGIFALCIGIFFTLTYIYTINYTLYNEIIPIDKIDQE